MTGRAVPRLRVTVVAPYGLLGGAELWLLTLLANTDRLDVEAVLLADGPLHAELDKLGVPVRVLPTGRRPVELARSSARLAGWLRASRPVDLVLANGVKAALVAAPAARLAGIRCAWVKHDHSCDGRLTALLGRLVDGVLATSPSLAAAAGRPDAVVVPPPRPPRPLPGELARVALAGYGLDPHDNRPVLATVGRLVRYKGVEDAIRALALPGGTGWRLAVVGGPDPAEPTEPERLRRLATAAGVADRVVFTGPVPDVAGLLAGAQAVAVLTKPTGDPSSPGREGFGTVALEAMTAGVPVLATAPGPVADRLAGPRSRARGPAGLTVPAGDPTAVAAALRRLGDPDTRARLGAAGAESAADHPDAAACAARLARTLARLACRPGAGLAGGPPVSVVVTVLDEAGAVDRLLAPLTGQLAHPADEILVVDGGSVDGTADRIRTWARRDRRVRLLVRPGAGIGAGRNAGVRAAANALVACTDAGCDPAAGWLAAFRAAAVDAAAEQAGPGLLTGVYRAAGAGPVQAAMAAVGYPDPGELRRPSPLVRCYGRLFGRTFDPALPTGRSVAFGVPAWRAVGGFPERLRAGEDVLFGRALVAAGVPAAMVADAEVVWTQRPSLTGAAWMYFRYGQGSGRSADGRLLGRDLARLAGYAGTGCVLLRGGPVARAGLAAGWAGYLSLPLVRVARQAGPGRVRTALAVPLVAAIRDLAKAAGAVHGLLPGRVKG